MIEPEKLRAEIHQQRLDRGYTPLQLGDMVFGQQAWCCPDCSSVIIDVDKHDYWHAVVGPPQPIS